MNRYSEMRYAGNRGFASGVFVVIALFLAAPFIALSYVIALPIVGFYTFAKLAVEAWQKKRATN